MLFPAADAKLQWREPWFFTIRTRGTLSWLVRLCVFAAFTGLFVFLLAQENAAGPGRQFNTAEKIALPIIVGAVLVALLEVPTLRRVASITADGIECVGEFTILAGPLLWVFASGYWGRREVERVELLRPREAGNRFSHGLLVVFPKYGNRALVGVAADVPLEKLTDTLHSIGLAPTLSGWRSAAAPADDNLKHC